MYVCMHVYIVRMCAHITCMCKHIICMFAHIVRKHVYIDGFDFVWQYTCHVTVHHIMSYGCAQLHLRLLCVCARAHVCVCFCVGACVSMCAYWRLCVYVCWRVRVSGCVRGSVCACGWGGGWMCARANVRVRKFAYLHKEGSSLAIMF